VTAARTGRRGVQLRVLRGCGVLMWRDATGLGFCGGWPLADAAGRCAVGG
jgi:hypothetical protein